jgi:hypothetical protein
MRLAPLALSVLLVVIIASPVVSATPALQTPLLTGAFYNWTFANFGAWLCDAVKLEPLIAALGRGLKQEDRIRKP